MALDIGLVNGLKTINKGLTEMADDVNLFTDNIEDNKNKEITDALLASGFSPKDIMNYIDVSSPQLEKYLDKRVSELFVEMQQAAAEAS